MGTGRLLAVLALVACAAAPVDAAGPKTRYERVIAQEQALRLQSRRPSPLSQIRRVVAAYEGVARRHPTSGYADNALMQAAELSLTAHRLYGSDVDRQAAARMLQWLVNQYPHSSLLVKARQMLRKAKPVERLERADRSERAPASVSMASMRGTASPVLSTPGPTTPGPATGGPAPPVAGANTFTATARGAAVPAAANAATAAPLSLPASRAAGAMLHRVTRTAVDDLVRITLEFDGEVQYQQERLDGPARLYFDLKNVHAVPSLQDTTLSFTDDSVRHIRLGRPKQDMTRLVIDLAGVERYSVFALYNPYRLTIDLQRRTPRLQPLVARRAAESLAATAPRLASAQVPRDLGIVRQIPPRPLPHPLADMPRVTSRPVTAQVATLLRVRPIAANRRGMPMSAPPASAIAGSAIAADISAWLAPKPIAGSRHGLPLNTPAAKAPKATAVAARVHREDAEAAAARDATAREASAREMAAREAALREAGREDTKGREQTAAANAIKPTPLPNRPGAPMVLPAPTAPATNASGGFSLARQLGLGVARIVIDPGHGGHDPGNLGNKVNESEVVLDVALRLEKLLLAEPGFEVVMTRRTDAFIPLEERTAIANRHHADLFLSIHANSSRNKQASGVETYYLNFATNPEAEAVAARENAGASQTMNHLPEIVRAIALNNKLDESRDFAQVVQEAMVGRLKTSNAQMKDRGVKQAPFVVLIGAGMPSVLAEIAFLTHQQEASLMRTGNYRQKVAEALFDAVKAYQRSLKNVGTVAAQVDSSDRD